VWSPDGSWVYFSSDREGNRNLYRRRTDFSGDAEIVLDREFAQWPGAVSAEGLISAVELTPDGSFDIIVVSTESGEVHPLAATPAVEGAHALSPDGRWIAYFSTASQSPEVYVEPFPEGGGRVTISNNGGNHPVWSPDGRTIFFSQGSKMLAVDVTTEPEFSHGAPYELFDHPYYASFGRQFDIAPDGERFLMLETNEAAAESSSRINIILNWFEELKQRVPTGR